MAPLVAQAVTVVQRSMRNEDPAQLMQTLGFGPLLLISNFVVKMSGDAAAPTGATLCVCICVRARMCALVC